MSVTILLLFGPILWIVINSDLDQLIVISLIFSQFYFCMFVKFSMDPRQFNCQAWSDFEQNYPPLSGENSQYPTYFLNFPNINEESEPLIGSILESQFPQLSSQVCLDSISLDEGGRNTDQRKTQARF